MASRRPLVLVSGVTSELPTGDTVVGANAGTLVAGSGLDGGGALVGGTVTVNASIAPAASGLIFVGDALGIDGSAIASGNAALASASTALASGNAGISTGLTALSSGNAALVSAATAQASGNAALSSAATAQASGNAALSSVSSKYDKTGGPISGPAFTQSQTFGVPSGTIQGSGVITLNFGARDNFELVLTAASSTLASPVNASGGQCGALIIRQDSVGTRLLTYSGSWSFASNTAPTLTTSASGIDMFGYYVVNPSRINIVSNLNYGSGTVS
jgi:hypothetical protein